MKMSRQSEKFLIGQSRKFLLTAARLKDGTDCDEPRGGSPVLHPLGEPLTTGKRLRHEEASPWPASRRADLSKYEADSQAGSLTCAYEKSARNWGTVRDSDSV